MMLHALTIDRAVLKGGAIGGVAGLVVGTAGVLFASRRYQAFRQLTVPFRVFIPVAVGTFTSPSSSATISRPLLTRDVGIIAADRASANYETHRNKQRLA